MQSFRELGRDIFGGEFGRQLGGAGVAPLVFLLRDDFTTDAAAPLPSPRTSEPGPGTLTITDTENKASISGGKLVFAGGKASPAYTDPAVLGGILTRAAGLSLLCDITFSATNKHIRIGLRQSNEDTGEIVHFSDIATINIRDVVVANVGSYAAATYKVAVICRTVGSFVFIKGGIYTSWTLLWIDVFNSASSLLPAIYNYDSAATFGLLRALQLPAPFDTDYGLATQRLAGAQSAGQTFVHEANCVLEFVVTTLSSGSDIHVNFRYLDTNNRWRVSIDSAGTFYLSEFTAGVGTVRATASTVVSAGHRIVIVAEGSVIRGYSNNVLRWTYSSASAGDSNTNGNINSLGTGGIVSDIISWPHTLAGAAAALLDAAVA